MILFYICCRRTKDDFQKGHHHPKLKSENSRRRLSKRIIIKKFGAYVVPTGQQHQSWNSQRPTVLFWFCGWMREKKNGECFRAVVTRMYLYIPTKKVLPGETRDFFFYFSSLVSQSTKCVYTKSQPTHTISQPFSVFALFIRQWAKRQTKRIEN